MEREVWREGGEDDPGECGQEHGGLPLLEKICTCSMNNERWSLDWTL